MKILRGGKRPRSEDLKSRAELSILQGERQNKRPKRLIKSEVIEKIISSASTEAEAVKRLESTIHKEIWTGSGRYRATSYYGGEGEYVTVEYDGSYTVSLRDARGRVLFLSIEPSLQKAARSFFRMWQYAPHHGPLRL